MLWYCNVAAVGACMFLSVPSIIRAAKLRRHEKRLRNAAILDSDGELYDVRRKSIELEDGPKPYTQSICTQQRSRLGQVTAQIPPAEDFLTAYLDCGDYGTLE